MRGEGVETGGTESLAERRQKVLVALGRIDLIEVDVTDTDLAKTIDRSNEYQSAKDREIEKARTALETQIFESLGRVDLVVPHRPRVPESDTSTSSSVPSFKGTLMDLQALADSFYPKPAVPVSPSSLFVRLEGPAEMMEASKSPRRKVIELFLQFVLGLKSSGRARY